VTELRAQDLVVKSLAPDRVKALDALPDRAVDAAEIDDPSHLVARVADIFQSTVCLVAAAKGRCWILTQTIVDRPVPLDEAIPKLLNRPSASRANFWVASTGAGNWTVVSAQTNGRARLALLIAGDWRLCATALDSLAAKITWPAHQSLSQASDRQRRATRLARRLTRISGMSPVCDEIVAQIGRSVRARFAALAVVDDVDPVLSIKATYGYSLLLVEHLRIKTGVGIIGQVHQSGKPMYATQTASMLARQPRRLRYETDFFMAIPIWSRGAVIAVVSVADPIDKRPFTRRDLSFLQALAGPAALALDRELALVRASTYAQAAAIDPISGLFNRRYFHIRLEEELQRAQRHQIPVTLLMADLDDFKSINDLHGHLVGDAMIRETAEILRRSVRVFDVCTRFGGEEFAVIMPGNGPEAAITIAERIRDQVAAYRSDDPQLNGLSMTVSIGVAVSSAETSAHDLILQADQALYLAKRGGKNRVWFGPSI
jgi:diguanylate cyclase (GGDEF)-like protein